MKKLLLLASLAGLALFVAGPARAEITGIDIPPAPSSLDAIDSPSDGEVPVKAVGQDRFEWITASGTGDMILASTQSVTGGKDHTSYIGISSGALADLKFRVITDTDTGVYFTDALGGGAHRLYFVANSTPSFLIERKSSGNLGFGAALNYDTTLPISGEQIPEFKYNGDTNGKVYTRSNILTEAADAVDLALRRFNGTFGAPTPVLADEYVGNLYFQAMGSDGKFDAGPSPGYGRMAGITAQTYGAPTGTNRAGKLIFYTTPSNDVISRMRVWVTPEGRLFAGGGSNYEWSTTLDTSTGVRTGTLNPQNYHGSATLEVIAPTNTVTESAIAIRSMSNGNNPTIGNGFDIDYSSLTNVASFSMVNADTKTNFMTVDKDSRTVSLFTNASDSPGLNQIMRWNNDFGWRQDTTTGHFLHLDTNNSGWNATPIISVDRVGPKFGVNVTTPAVTVHVVGADGRVGSFPTLAATDNIVLENNAGANLTFVSSATSASQIRWYKSGETGGVANASIQFNPNTKLISMAVDNVGNLKVSSLTVTSVAPLTLSSSVVAGGTEGTAGYVLTSGGSGAAVSWSAPTSAGASTLEVMGNSVRITSPTVTLSLIAGTNVTLTTEAVSGTTAQITISATGGGSVSTGTAIGGADNNAVLFTSGSGVLSTTSILTYSTTTKKFTVANGAGGGTIDVGAGASNLITISGAGATATSGVGSDVGYNATTQDGNALVKLKSTEFAGSFGMAGLMMSNGNVGTSYSDPNWFFGQTQASAGTNSAIELLAVKAGGGNSIIAEGQSNSLLKITTTTAAQTWQMGLNLAPTFASTNYPFTFSASSVGFTGNIEATYGVKAATGTITGSTLSINGVNYQWTPGVASGGYFKVATSSAISISATVAAADVAAGSLGASVLASSITLASMYGAPTLTGTNFTAIPAASISAGSLGSSVIASSITLAAMYGAPTLVGTNFTSLPGAQVGSGVPAANIAAGSLGGSVIASSVAASGVTAGSYGSDTVVPRITVTQDGRITAVSSQTLSAGALSAAYRGGTFGATWDGGGSALTTGTTYWVRLSTYTAATLSGFTLTGLPSGSLTLNVSSSTVFNTNPVSICASQCPSFTTTTSSSNYTLGGWTTSLSAGGYVYFVVNSAATCTQANLTIDYLRP